MTLPEALSRLAAAGRIRSAWLPGMLVHNADGLVRVDVVEDGLPHVVRPDYWKGGCSASEIREAPEPVAGDPATVGCLLALLREALRDPSVYLAPNAESEIRPDGTSPLWFAYTGRGKGPIGVGPTEYAAVVAALDAAAERLEPTP